MSQRLPPTCPEYGELDPELTVDRAELRPRRRALVDGELVGQGQVLEGKLKLHALRSVRHQEHYSRCTIAGARRAPLNQGTVKLV